MVLGCGAGWVPLSPAPCCECCAVFPARGRSEPAVIPVTHEELEGDARQLLKVAEVEEMRDRGGGALEMQVGGGSPSWTPGAPSPPREEQQPLKS